MELLTGKEVETLIRRVRNDITRQAGKRLRDGLKAAGLPPRNVRVRVTAKKGFIWVGIDPFTVTPQSGFATRIGRGRNRASKWAVDGVYDPNVFALRPGGTESPRRALLRRDASGNLTAVKRDVADEAQAVYDDVVAFVETEFPKSVEREIARVFGGY